MHPRARTYTRTYAPIVQLAVGERVHFTLTVGARVVTSGSKLQWQWGNGVWVPAGFSPGWARAEAGKMHLILPDRARVESDSQWGNAIRPRPATDWKLQLQWGWVVRARPGITVAVGEFPHCKQHYWYARTCGLRINPHENGYAHLSYQQGGTKTIKCIYSLPTTQIRI